MAGKPNVVPTAAILIVAVFLLITFWRNNLEMPSYGHSNENGSTTTVQKSGGQMPEPVTVTVTVTAAAAAAEPTAAGEEKLVAAPNTPVEQVPIAPKAAAAAAVAAQQDQPRYIFVDLGANGADSLETFLQTPSAKFKYNFPTPPWATHDEAEIFLFEANPVFNDALVYAKQKHGALGRRITIYPSTVVDTKDGLRTFYLDEVNSANDYWGSSTYKNHPDAVASGAKGTELSAVNIARWLLMNTLPRDFVVVKMDIEGAEYDILPHLAEMRVWTVVDVLLVEWHDNLPTDEARQAAIKGIEKLKHEGVSCPKYDSAT
ncbi:hypothetical protein PWT90_10840 [Aphanocladium album]|nr:hypothetical protein PWT90_10840 [Aphanocladium album]